MSGILSSLQGIGGKLTSTFWSVLDRIVPPEKRAEGIAKIQNWAISNPKLAAFLLTQIALTGFPLFLFITFSITVFLFALIVGLLLAVLGAVLFTVAMVLVALVIVLPTIFVTTFAATFTFLWGLGGYYILKWFNDGSAPAPDGTAIGDKLNSLTGGRMGWLMEGTRKKADDARTGVDKTPKTHGSKENGSAKPAKKQSEGNGSAKHEKKDSGNEGSLDVGKATSTAKENVEKHGEEVHKRPPKLANGAASGAASAAGAAKGATSGVSG